MFDCCGLGGIRVGCAKRLDDLPMLRQRAALALLRAERRRVAPLDKRAHAGELAAEEGVARGPPDDLVEVVIEADDATYVAADGSLQLGRHLVEHREIELGAMSRRKPGCEPLEVVADLAGVGQFIGAELHHRRRPSGGADQPVHLEPVQRLANRGAAHARARSDHLLRHAVVRCELATQDRLPQMLVQLGGHWAFAWQLDQLGRRCGPHCTQLYTVVHMSGGRSERRVYEGLSDALVAEGVEDVFALLGDGNLELVADLAQRARLRLIHVRHEQGAVSMADGYARFSRRVGIASVTHGPGLSNTATSLLTAAAARSPLVLVAADTPAADVHHPQAFDQATFARASRAHVQQLHAAATLADDVAGAFRHARQARGPVVLNAPADVLREPLPETTAPYVPRTVVAGRAVPERGAIEAAGDALRRAERPAILAGAGAALSDGAETELAELARLLGAPIATTLMAHGLLSASPRAVGVAGQLGSGKGSAALRAADCVLAVGASLDGWTTDGGLPSEAVVLHVDVDPAAIGRHERADVELVGDAGLAVSALLDELDDLDGARETWWSGVTPRLGDAGSPAADGLPPRDVVAALDRALPDRRLLVVDAGHFSGFAQQGLRSSHAHDYTFSHQFGAIGQGLGIALGAAVARPGERVTAVLGDGCLLMSVAELDTLARYELPVTVFVMDDGGYGQERHALDAKGFDPSEATFTTPDLVALAAGFGVPGTHIHTPGELDALPAILAAADGPLLVDVRVDSGIRNRSFDDIASRLRGADQEGDT
jgi:acetolactate synthase-1/2/3 large subunit